VVERRISLAGSHSSEFRGGKTVRVLVYILQIYASLSHKAMEYILMSDSLRPMKHISIS
jgi:hypothetical protein